MNCIEVTDKKSWDEFISAQPFAQFTQSWTWGEFQQSRGKKVRRYACEQDGVWVAAIQMEFRERRFGLGYWFAPRGPIFAASVSIQERRSVMLSLCELLLQQKELSTHCLFWRMEPFAELARPEGLLPSRFRRNAATNPSSTYVIDLKMGEEDLLKVMHEKTRYNIRVAEKHGVTVRTSTASRDFELFLTLMDETAKRDGFVQHDHDYLRATFDALVNQEMAQIRLAEWKGKALAANLEVMCGDTVTYLYGASSSSERQVMAPYAIHWSALRDAKQRGYLIYDMWGANPQSQAMYYYKESWEGITRFKKNWGGRLVNFVGTWDLPFNRVLYRLAFLRKFLRG